MALGQEKRRKMLDGRREGQVARYNRMADANDKGGHVAVACVIARAPRGPKGPLAPLRTTWWCGRCHGASHAPKNLLGVACKAPKGTSSKLKN
eukprot:13377386-Alexandrium_andersonii.AAC.1